MEHIIVKLLEDFERGMMTRRQLVQTLAFTATAASAVSTADAAAPANALYINHVSMQVADYTKTRDFYSGLFGMKVTNDDGKTQCRLTFGDNILIARSASSRPGGKVGVDHIAYTLANWDTDKTVKPAVEADEFVKVFALFAVHAQHVQAARVIEIVSHQHPAVARAAEIF